MDITRAFKATIKTVRMRKKVTLEEAGPNGVSKDVLSSKSCSTFKQRSREIVSFILTSEDISSHVFI